MTTTSTATPVAEIPPIGHDKAMDLADAEYALLLADVDALTDTEWALPTDCTGWDVKDLLGHILGMLELQADPGEMRRQVTAAATEVAVSGGWRLDAMTALQVREHAHLSPGQLRARLREAVPRGLAARRAMPAQMRANPYDPQLPGVTGWTVGYLFDVIHTRDPWLHRVDLARATGRPPMLTPEHDGRIVADVVADWARTHQQPFELTLSGPAGGRHTAGTPSAEGADGAELDLDAVEFCRVLSGRAAGTGLLATRVVF